MFGRLAGFSRGLQATGAACVVLSLDRLGGTRSSTADGGDGVLHEPTFKAASAVRKGQGLLRNLPPNSLERNTSDLSSLILLAGSSHRDLAMKISELIGVPVAKASVSRFSDGEVSIQVNDSLRGQDVFVVQTCAAPVNDSIIELLLTVSCARRSGAKRVIAVIPYFGYKHHRRGSVVSTTYHSRFLSSGAMDFAKMLQEMGVDRVISVDLQRPGQGQEACFFDTSVPLEVVLSNEAMVRHLVNEVKLADRIVVVSANTEGFKKARKFQVGLLNSTASSVQLATFVSRESTGSGPIDTTKLELLGDNLHIDGADVLIVDDMVDTAGTLAVLSRHMQTAGARNIYVVASHGVFTDQSMKLIEDCPVNRVFVTDSLPLPANASSKVEQVSIARQLGHIILAEYFRTLSTTNEEKFLEDEWTEEEEGEETSK